MTVGNEKTTPKGSQSRRQRSPKPELLVALPKRRPKDQQRRQRQSKSPLRSRVHPENRGMDEREENKRLDKKTVLRIETNGVYGEDKDDGGADDEKRTPDTAASTPRTPGVRSTKDLRSPGARKSPITTGVQPAPLPDFITQTDANGNASTPRSADAIAGARMQRRVGPGGNNNNNGGAKRPGGNRNSGSDRNKENEGRDSLSADPCETLLDSIRLMCCCLAPEDSVCDKMIPAEDTAQESMEEERDDRIRLLGPICSADTGKKCLVLDLDETLVHSSFRAVPGADFVIPVQIEDVVHFVYVAKRPGVDEFLTEMAKHYEIVIYTASLNKYADPLLDLLDPNQVIRYRLFRESCVYYQGNYVKDLSVLDRDLSQTIIIDNSPNSYIFHPENAIDCSSFIDDPKDTELYQIGSFLAGAKNVKDVRGVCHLWREWPDIRLDSYQ